MSHFAKVNSRGIVEQVIVAEQDVIDSGLFGNPTGWVQTSYNTHGGQHPEGRPLRKNYAGIGYVYDPIRDAFYPQKPFPSWVLDEDTCLWDAPVAMPNDGKPYSWNEEQQTWNEVAVQIQDVEVVAPVEEVVVPTELTVEVPVAEVTIDVGTASATPTI